MKTQLGKFLQHWRSLNLCSLYSMAKDLRMMTAHLSAIEHGRIEPTNDELFLIACYLSGKDYQKSKQEAEHRKRVFKEMLDTIYKVQAE
ncbi:hypothetical protein [Haemophilus sputorum]|jgi:hypothetical protein